MTPAPQERNARVEESPRRGRGERVVISGMAGVFPASNHVKDLADILYNKKNPINIEGAGWTFNHPEVSHYVGKVPQPDRFDAQFFKVHYRLSQAMDPMARKILEQAYQAIYDAGVNPEHLSGKYVGVYIGSCFSETEKAGIYASNSRSGLGIAGCSKSMFANRVSYWLNVKGPSMSIDDACCSSLAALEQAYLSVERGECEFAIAAGANMCLHPHTSLHYARIMKLNMDGKTMSFDENANGIVRSEAINVLFLQKAKDAKRIYAEVVHVKTGFSKIPRGETGPKYGFYRDPITMTAFMDTFYQEAKVLPQAVEYVEAVGSAIPEADKAELEVFEAVFCKGRTDPLLVGSVMSNIGYGEAASGISGIAKVLLGYHHGEMAANLHCANPRKDVAALRDGRMEIVTDHAPFRRSYTAVNGISVTGVNAHVLLHGNFKPKDPSRYQCSIPRLVTISGRQESAVANILEDLKSRPIDPEELALFNNIHQTKISGHLGRGYIILDTNEEKQTVSLAETSSYFDGTRRPLWFVYSGMGSQWTGMGAQLMRMPIFAAAIERCRKVLEPKGVDIVHIITSPDDSIFDNILNSFVGIAAVQIGLTDVLTALGIVPDNIIGHSVGELGCAYADGCFTAEEMILAAYSRGLVSVQTPFIHGSMAAVGIGYQEIVKLIPPEIEVACHNGPGSATISGPAEVMKKFVAKLSAQGIFAKEVPCSNIAYHSRYIAEAAPGLRKYLKEVIKDPKPRTERWLSTSVPESKWNTEEAKYSSAEYHTNNLLSSVLFEETSAHIPSNAVLIEVAPHGLLQAILKRSLPETCRNISMTRRGHQDNAFMVLDAIGKLYMEGYYPKVQAIYPRVEFPVSTGTPMLSHLVEWAYGEQWDLAKYTSVQRRTAACCKFVISVHDDEHKYLNGHVIRGKTLYPFSAALVAAWDAFSMSLELPKKEHSVTFNDVHFYCQPAMHDFHHVRLSVTLHRGTGKFEVMDEDRKVATGILVNAIRDNSRRVFGLPSSSDEELEYNSDHVYQMLHERDYSYSGDFRSINKVTPSLTTAEIIWKDNWVTFIDGMLQLHVLRHKHDTVSQLWHIGEIAIDVKQHFLDATTVKTDEKTVIMANVLETRGITRCGGVLMTNVQHHKLPKVPEDVVLKSLKFIPRSQFKTDVSSALEVYLQIVSENVNKDVISALKILKCKEDSTVFNGIESMIHDVDGVRVKYEQILREKMLSNGYHDPTDFDLMFVHNLSSDDNLCQTLHRFLQRDAFLINAEETTEERIRPSTLYKVVSTIEVNQTKLELIRWRPTQNKSGSTVMTVRSTSDLSLLTATRASLSKTESHRLTVLSTYPPVQGLKALVKKWRKETDRNQIYLVMVSEKENLEELPDLDLAFNVLNNSVWGGEYYTSWNDKMKATQGVTLQISNIGDLDSLYWAEATEPVSNSDIMVNVHYAAINDFDVKRATGVIPFNNDDVSSETSFGMDFSGLTDSGQRVMGILPSGSVSSRVRVKPELVWPVPDNWTLEEAATVPSAYAHALYCFTHKTKFLKGISVLIHSGTGALGQAAIAIALAHDCQVYTTVSDVRKKRFLMKLFPQLKEERIGNSRDCSFGDMVNLATKGHGIDFVLCDVKGELKNVSFNICTDIMVDITQIQSQEKYSFGMNYLSKERSYIPLDFLSIFKNPNTEELRKIQLLITAGISGGYIRPLTHTTYVPSEVPRAFRLVAAGRHRGRAVLRIKDSQAEAQPRISCSPDLCHLVLTDQNALGLQLADRLVSRGVKKLRVHFKIPPISLKSKIESWQKLGVKVQTSSEDLSNNKGIISLLNNSSHLGPLEGIYYVVSSQLPEESVNKLNSVVANLDLAARKICPSIRYFAVVSVGVTIGEQTCLSRSNHGLPATAIQLSALKMVQLSQATEADAPAGALSWRGAVDATERALRSAQPTLLAQAQPTPFATLLQHIAHIADIQISEDVPKTTTLLELGIENAKVPQICSHLRDMHNIALNEEDIQNLSMEKIMQLDMIASGSEYKKTSGMSTFISFVDPDELQATNEIVFLPTLSNRNCSREDEFDVTESYLIVVPGLEGHYGRFRVLCERLKLNALVLQPGLDFPNETPKETAQRYCETLLSKNVIRKNYYIMGYERGVLIALEMAAVLEHAGITGTVFCVGCTPEEYKSYIEEELGEYKTKEALQTVVARHMFGLMAGNTDALDKVLQNDIPWEEKIEICVRMLLGRVAHSSQYARALIKGAYIRIEQTRSYKCQVPPLGSKLVLLHAAPTKQNEANWHELALKTMQRYSTKPVVVEDLQAPLAHAAYDLRCPSIINKHLDSEILDAFEKKNICESYALISGTFMGTENVS